MAYARRSARRSTGYRTTRRTSTRRAPVRRASTRRVSRAAPRDIRIVIEQSPASQVSRPSATAQPLPPKKPAKL